MFNSGGNSKTKQNSEQQTSQATGINSIATGKMSLVMRDVFGTKNLAAPDYSAPVLIVAVTVIGSMLIWKRL